MSLQMKEGLGLEFQVDVSEVLRCECILIVRLVWLSARHSLETELDEMDNM